MSFETHRFKSEHLVPVHIYDTLYNEYAVFLQGCFVLILKRLNVAALLSPSNIVKQLHLSIIRRCEKKVRGGEGERWGGGEGERGRERRRMENEYSQPASI